MPGGIKEDQCKEELRREHGQEQGGIKEDPCQEELRREGRGVKQGEIKEGEWRKEY